MNMKKNIRKNLVIAAMAMGMMGTVAVVGACSSCMANSSVSINSTVDFSQSDLVQKSFTKIEVETVADVYYTQNNGSKESVRFDFSQIKDEKLRQQYQEKVVAIYRDGKVIIGLKKNISGSQKLNKGSRLRVYITSPDLVKVTMEGVGYFHSDAINSDTFTIDNEGVGNIDIKNLLANQITVDNEGVGSVTVANMQGDFLDIDNEGVGSVTVARFKGGKLKIDNEGVGSVKAQVDCQSIQAVLEGVGSIHLSGVTRQLTKQKEGVGSFDISDLKVLGK